MKHRVLHVIDHTGSGGAQVVIRDVVRMLKNQFYFTVAVLGNPGTYSDAYESLGVPVLTFAHHSSRWNPTSFGRLFDTIRRERFDLVHTHLLKASILGTIAARWAGTRIIVHDHSGVYPQTLKYHISNGLVRHSYLYAYRYAVRQCDRVLVVTQNDARSYAELFGIAQRKITVLPNGVDLEEFSPFAKHRRNGVLRQELGLSAETNLVVMVGRLDPKKDWLTFLQVAHQVHQQSDRSCGFLIVGSGPEERHLQEYVIAHKLKHVFFLGNRDDIPSLLQQADVFLLTSQRESFGISLLEAMAAGCPVIATRTNGPESILTDGGNGLLAEIGDVHGLASHVIHLLRDKALARRLACRARQTVLTHYSLETVTTRMAKIYEEILQQ